MVNLKKLLQNQLQKEVLINENTDVLSPAGIFGWKGNSGLTYSYYGGDYPKADGTKLVIADGSVSLTASTTNYVYFNVTSNAVECSTSPVANGNIEIATITTNSTGMTANPVSNRMIPLFPKGASNGLAGGGGGGGGSALTIKDEGTTLTTGATEINITGAGATATVVGTVVTLNVPGGGGGGGGSSNASNVNTNVVQPNVFDSMDSGYQGYTMGVLIPATKILNTASKFKCILSMQCVSNFNIGNMVLLKTARNSSTVLASIPVTIGGVSNPTITSSGSGFTEFTTDEITENLDGTYDYWMTVYFVNTGPVINAAKNTSSGGPLKGGYIIGDQTGVSTVNFTSSVNINAMLGSVIVTQGIAVAGASALEVKDEGTSLSTAVASIDFVGAGVTASHVGGAITITVPGSSGGAPTNYTVQNISGNYTIGSGDKQLIRMNTAGQKTITLPILSSVATGWSVKLLLGGDNHIITSNSSDGPCIQYIQQSNHTFHTDDSLDIQKIMGDSTSTAISYELINLGTGYWSLLQ